MVELNGSMINIHNINQNDSKYLLSKLMNQSNKEIVKNEIYKEMISLLTYSISKNKKFISKISSFKGNTKTNSNKLIENELINYNKELMEYKNGITCQIDEWKQRYDNGLQKLEEKTAQLKLIEESTKNHSFFLENQLEGKINTILKLREMLLDSYLNIKVMEVNKDTSPDYFESKKEEKKITNQILDKKSFIMQSLLYYKCVEFNKMSNKNKRLKERINKLKNIIKYYRRKNIRIKEQSDKNLIKIDKSTFLENIKKNKIYNNSSDNLIRLDISSDESNFSENDSLCFDTEEQIDIEFPEKDISSSVTNKKNNSYNIKGIKIPKLNLDLIKYNIGKDNIYGEKSLSRENLDDKQLINESIRNIKKQIKSNKCSGKNLKKKCNKYEKKIQRLATQLYNLRKKVNDNNPISKLYNYESKLLYQI